MSQRVSGHVIATLLVALVCLSIPTSAQAPEMMAYQGYLLDGATDLPLDGAHDLVVSLYAFEAASTPVWSQTFSAVNVVDGVFNVVLGPSGTPRLALVSFAAPLWIGVSVDGSELAPRTPLSSAPYALGMRGLRVVPDDSGSPSLIGGNNHNGTAPGVRGATISGGGSWTTSQDYSNSVLADFGTIGGGFNNEAGGYGTIAGGINNVAGEGAVIGGGRFNDATALDAAIGGGRYNDAIGEYSTVAGGSFNYAYDDYTSVGGGYDNKAGLSGGDTASQQGAVVGGGSSNRAQAAYATIAGGVGNAAGAAYGSVVGGWDNAVSAEGGTIGGGGPADADPANTGNRVYDGFGTVGGGSGNAAGSDNGNPSDDRYATVAGGRENTASGLYSAIAGGRDNLASGNGATIAGGQENVAAGDFSSAAGIGANALHRGTYVWSDALTVGTPIQSTGENQFLIRARGGVGIGTTQPGTNSGSILPYGAQLDVRQYTTGQRGLHVYNSAGTGLTGATMRVHNASTSAGIAAAFYTYGTDATLVVEQNGTGDHIRTFDNGQLRFQVTDTGNVRADGTFTSPAADLAEAVRTVGPSSMYGPGLVLRLSERRPGHFEPSAGPYDPNVAGVVATKPGVLLGQRTESQDLRERVPLGVVGIIPTLVTAENGPIAVGDLLVTSSTPGHAMRAERDDPIRLIGAVIGKAMEPFAGPGVGRIEVLVNVK